jgi:CxxC-x17-CxxC domain-containing protein
MEGRKFKAVCSKCGQDCEVPFEPKEGRPVKCSDCFRKDRPRGNFSRGNREGNRGGFSKGNFSRGNFSKDTRKDFDVVCAECGKKTTVPFKPSQGKPVLCRECYRK